MARVHVFTCKAVASPYPYSSCSCIYLQGCGIIVSTFLMFMYLPERLWHHRINISRVHDCIYLKVCGITVSTFLVCMTVFTCKVVASPYPYSSCTCIYLQGCGITVSIFLVYMYLPVRQWHHRIHISRVHVFTCKAVASPYPYSSCTCIYL